MTTQNVRLKAEISRIRIRADMMFRIADNVEMSYDEFADFMSYLQVLRVQITDMYRILDGKVRKSDAE